MSLMNRLGNARNPYQTNAKRVLCVCSAGLLRSPTAANVLHKEFGFNTRAVGVSQEYALIPIDQALLSWADEIVCVEPEVDYLVRKYIETKTTMDIDWYNEISTVLDIPDEYSWGSPVLQQTIMNQYMERSKA